MRCSALLALVAASVFGLVVACSGSGTAPSCVEPAATTGQALETEGYCAGDAVDCDSINVSSCASQPGCYVDLRNVSTPSDDTCRGAARPCSGESTKSSCVAIDGCRWTEPTSTGGSSSGASPAPAASAAPCGSPAPTGTPTGTPTASPSGTGTTPSPSPSPTPPSSADAGGDAGSDAGSDAGPSSSSGGPSNGGPSNGGPSGP